MDFRIIVAVVTGLLLLVAGSRLEIALQQAGLTPEICIANKILYQDSQEVAELLGKDKK